MKLPWLSSLVLACVAVLISRADSELFHDNFNGKLDKDWSWVREHREAWRVTERGLEVRIEPGNMWGPANNAKNVLVRPAPDAAAKEIEISVRAENQPTGQYEQVDLVWYYDDSHMVKLGQELVNGKLSIVMGREERDKTRTIAIIPISSSKVQLKLLVSGNQIRGHFRTSDAEEWREAGQCDLPAPADGKPRISLQFYQGLADVEHWARVNEFRIRQKSR